MNEEDSLGGERSWLQDITRYQWMVLLVTTLGWGLDGFDGVLYTLVLGPSVTELLNNPSSSELAFYGGLAASLYLYGWALGAVLFGILADYFGRVRVLSVSILTYALFTGLCAIVTEYWQLAAFRFIAGLGSGVELPVGAALIAETWNNRYRSKATGIMMSGFAVGFFLASVAYWLVGGYGWRVVFLLGLLPALTVFIIRRNVHEPETMAEVRARRAERKAALRAGAAKTTEDRFVLSQLLRPPLLKRTVPAMLICIGGLFSFWAITTWTPEVVRNVMEDRGIIDNAAIPYVASITAALHLGGIVGYASWGFIADRIGRKPTMAISILAVLVGVWLVFPVAHEPITYLILVPIVGFGMTGIFSGTAVYFPEFFPPAVRASAMALTNSTGRVLTAIGPLVAGSIAVLWFGGNLGLAVAVISSLIGLGLLGLVLLPETRGRFIYERQPQPEEVMT
ncbi:MAG TPA: MFS transporter [Gemmatimonadales bacterium]|nr:MFS transporter [Gemmatimonadales bacterium]